MDRTLFYKETTHDDIDQLDFAYNGLSGFKATISPAPYRCDESDVMRPDLISFRVYGTVKYWWIIMYVNGIKNPLTEIALGRVLLIPNILDVYTFYKNWRVRE
jgi:hypothetical protein